MAEWGGGERKKCWFGCERGFLGRAGSQMGHELCASCAAQSTRVFPLLPAKSTGCWPAEVFVLHWPSVDQLWLLIAHLFFLNSAPSCCPVMLQVLKARQSSGTSRRRSWWRTCQQTPGRPMERNISWGWGITSSSCPPTVPPTCPLCWVLSCMLCWPGDPRASTPLAGGLTSPSASSAASPSGSTTSSSARCWVLALLQGSWEHQGMKARTSEVPTGVYLTGMNSVQTLLLILSLLSCFDTALQRGKSLC